MLKMSSNVKIEFMNVEYRDVGDIRFLVFMVRISILFFFLVVIE